MTSTTKISGKSAMASLIETVTSEEVVCAMKLLDIKTRTQHKLALEVLNHLIDEDDKDNVVLITVLARRIEEYEREHFPIKKASPVEVVKFLMEQNGLTQAELAKDFGGQPAVSYFLKGERKLNTRQIEALSKRFNVSPAVFFEAA